MIARLRTIANGYWNVKNRKQLEGCKVKLFEAKLNKGQRILWEVAVSFSERRSKYGAVFTDVIRVWSVIEDHDDIDKHVSHVEAAHARGLDSKVKHQLETEYAPNSLSERGL